MKRKLLAVLVTAFVFFTVLTVSASATTQDGWVVVDGYYHYYEDGYHYTDGEYYIGDGYDAYFRFDENGRMFSDEWYQDEYGSRQYYKENGYRASFEIVEVDGALYAFDWEGRPIVGHGEVLIGSGDDADWRYVYGGEDGKLVTGWFQDGEAWYYYLPSGYAPRNEVVNVGGYWYAFDWYGMMYTEEGSIYNSETESSQCFRPTEGGSLITGWYLDEYDCWYYYGENGLTLGYGLHYVGNTPYCFYESGEMMTDSVFCDEEGGYSCSIDSNGVVTLFNVNGWTQVGSDWYYCENGIYVYGQIKEIGGTYYYFHHDGTMLSNGYTWVDYDEDIGQDIYVRAKASGALYVNEWYKDYNGNWYYYGEGGKPLIGFNYVGNTLYYFYSTGEMMTDQVYFDGIDTYYINEAGVAKKLNSDGWTSVTYQGEEKFIYCVGGQYLSDQIAIIGDVGYYFDGYFMAANDEYRVYDEETYSYVPIRAKASGALYQNEWYQDGSGDWMYFGEDYLAVRGLNVINGVEYLFGEYGELCQNDYCYDYYSGNAYVADANGAVVRTPGWYATSSSYFYINEDGSLYEGILESGGKLYELYPEMAYCYLNYTFDENGTWLYCLLPDGSLQWITADGLYNDDYNTYYLEGGKLYYGWKQIDGVWYYFDPGMMNNAFYNIYDNETEESAEYYFDVEGKLVTNSWIKLHRNYEYQEVVYAYADEYGRIVQNGIVAIGSGNYYFENGYLSTNTYFVNDEGIYLVNGSGVPVLLSEGDGWKLVDNNWYYVRDGYLCNSEMFEIDGYYYGFDYTGKMVTNGYLRDDYYFDEYGHLVEGWVLENGKWAYCEANYGRAWYGKYEIDGLYYYFEDGYLCYNKTIVDVYDGTITVVGADGTVVSESTINDGYVYDGEGGLYYIVNGMRYTGWSGNNYYYNGRMLIAEVEKIAGNYYYFDKKGNYVRGWYQPDEGEWYYSDEYGILKYNEWCQIGNVWYYFDGFTMCADGVYWLEEEDTYAQFAPSGAFMGYVTIDRDTVVKGTPGWQLNKDGKWSYYNAYGVRINYGEFYIGNSWYYFYNGKMLADEFVDGRYYTASGARLMATNEWKFIHNSWCYFSADARALSGWININGVEYYIERDSEFVDENGNVVDDYEDAYREVERYTMATGYKLMDETVHYFDASGAYAGEYIGNGWVQLSDGDFVYFMNGKLLRYGVYNIGGRMYAFSEYRLITSDKGVSVVGYYLVNESGVLYAPGWHNTANGWVYVLDDYTICRHGVFNIGGAVYYFYMGYMV